MPQAHYIDAVTLIHFATVGRLDLLEIYSSGHPPRWVDAVEAEISEGCKYAKSKATSDAILACGWLGEPAEPPLSKASEVDGLRVSLNSGTPPNSPTAHLGEAQCIWLARQDGGLVITDDGRAIELAGFLQVQVKHTVVVLQELVLDRYLTSTDACQLALDMCAAGRELHYRGPITPKEFET